MMVRAALLSLALLIACSSSSGTDGEEGAEAGRAQAGAAGATDGGTAGMSTVGGASGTPGTSGSSGVAGSAAGAAGVGNGGMGAELGGGGSGGVGGTAAAGGGGGQGGTAGAGNGGRPTVVILLDSSSSMFESTPPTMWDLVGQALVGPNVGVLQNFDEDIDFGFALYRGSAQPTPTETDPACAQMIRLAPSVGNADSIRTTYETAGAEWMSGIQWTTPTGYAVAAVAADLGASPPNAMGKFIVLVTDGNPNTCRVIDPKCGQDQSVVAVQDARRAGIRTLVVGIGEVISSSNTGCTTFARCGEEHLQDLANAGLNQPVVEPSPNYVYDRCVQVEPSGLLATYSAVGGTAPYYAPASVSEAQTAFSSIFEDIRNGDIP